MLFVVAVITNGLFRRILSWAGYILQHMVSPLSIAIKICCEKIREKEYFKNCKHYKKLDKDDLPQRPPHNHGAKSVIVKVKNIF